MFFASRDSILTLDLQFTKPSPSRLPMEPLPSSTVLPRGGTITSSQTHPPLPQPLLGSTGPLPLTIPHRGTLHPQKGTIMGPSEHASRRWASHAVACAGGMLRLSTHQRLSSSRMLKPEGDDQYKKAVEACQSQSVGDIRRQMGKCCIANPRA